MLRIGEFAGKNKITVRALRHYEEIGLLLPAETDRYTGYRYYNESQSKKLRVINTFKLIGFSLSEITDMLKGPLDKRALINKLNGKYMQARIDLDKAQSRSIGVEELLYVVKKMPGGNSIDLMEVSEMSMISIMDKLPDEELFRELFGKMFKKATETGGDICVIVMDIDNFKNINDKYGHKTGDGVLDAIAGEIIKNLPGGKGVLWEYKSILERKGGDEFMAVVDIEKAEGKILADNICKAVAGLDLKNLGTAIPVTLSIGVADMSANAVDSDELIRLADAAMYLAKHNGRNRCEYYSEDLKEKLNTKP